MEGRECGEIHKLPYRILISLLDQGFLRFQGTEKGKYRDPNGRTPDGQSGSEFHIPENPQKSEYNHPLC